MSFNHMAGTALITGASTGIGAIYADRLAQRGHDLILVARNKDRLQLLAEQLTDKTGRSIEVIVADLSEQTDLMRVEHVLRTDASITILVNNAGLGATSTLLGSDVEAMTDMVNVNVTALMRLCYAAIPGLAARGGGTVINISSIVAIAPQLLNGVYGASKAFVLALSQALQHELSDTNVRIQAVLPGVTATQFWQSTGTPLESWPGSVVMDAEQMVEAALAGLDHGESITIPSLPDVSDWDAYETARRAMVPKLSLSQPAARYTRRV